MIFVYVTFSALASEN